MARLRALTAKDIDDDELGANLRGRRFVSGGMLLKNHRASRLGSREAPRYRADVS